MGWLGGGKPQARTAFMRRHGCRSHPATVREQMNGAEGSGKCACCSAMKRVRVRLVFQIGRIQEAVTVIEICAVKEKH